jgi:hypothetical protein
VSNRLFKQFSHEVNDALSRPEAARPLKWSQYAITFESKDYLRSMADAGALPMLCTPTISNVAMTKTLIDGGASLNMISIETFETLQVPYDQLMPTRPFFKLTDGSTIHLGQVRLHVTFGTRQLPH